MKLTDIDLSSLAEVAAAVTLLEHVHRELATGGTPLPIIEIPADAPGRHAFVVNPAPSPAGGHTHWQDADAMERFVAAEAEKLRGQQVASPAVQALQSGVRSPDIADRVRADLGLPPLADAMADEDALRRAQPITGQPLPGRHTTFGEVVMTQTAPTPGLTEGFIGHRPTAIEMMRAASAQEAAAIVEQMDAAAVFGGAPAQSAAPLPPAPSIAGVAASPTAPAAPPASGALPTLPALAPLPAPVAAAPAASAAPSSPAGGVELDTDGLPWDDRIHAGTKRKNADGRWTSKRGINDPDLVLRVVKQLREMMAAGGVTATAPAPAAMPTLPEQPALPANPTSTLAALQAAMTPVAAQSAAPLPQSAPGTAGASASPTVHVAPLASGPTSPASAPTPTTYLDFMTAATVEVHSGRVPIEAFGAVCKSFGGVEALNAKPELIPVAWAALKAKYQGML